MSWSAEGNFAVVSGSAVRCRLLRRRWFARWLGETTDIVLFRPQVSVVDPGQGKLGGVSLKRGDKSPLSAYGVSDYSDSCPDSQFLADLSVRWPPYFTSAGWSPAGLGEKGGCLLLLASSDGQTTVHEAGGSGTQDWSSPCLSLSLSQSLFDLCKTANFDERNFGPPQQHDGDGKGGRSDVHVTAMHSASRAR